MGNNGRINLILSFTIGVSIATLIAYFVSVPPQKRSSFATTIQQDSRPSQFTVSTYDSDRVVPGFTLIPTTGDETVSLIDIEGQVVHSWNFDSPRVWLLDNCNILALHGTAWGTQRANWSEAARYVREYNWQGKVVWEHEVSEKAHHDVRRLASGNTLILERTTINDLSQTRAKINDPVRRELPLLSDTISEISPDGKTVWTFAAHKHLDWNSCGQRICPATRIDKLSKEVKTKTWLHTNTISEIPENRWFDAGDERFTPGNILFLPRDWWTVMIIDKRSKDLVWKYTGTKEDEIHLGHEAHMLPKELPGAGNILLFDNGSQERPYSTIREINPSTQETVWRFEDKEKFFSRSGGAVQRLTNGNTLISSDLQKTAFEVTPAGEIVWRLKAQSRIQRAKRYPVNYCAKLDEINK